MYISAVYILQVVNKLGLILLHNIVYIWKFQFQIHTIKRIRNKSFWTNWVTFVDGFHLKL